LPTTWRPTAYGPQLDGDRLLELVIRGVLETTLIYGIFHGDLHAGNVLIDRGDAFALVDLGICGRIDAAQRAALVRFMLAFAKMDAAGQLDALEPFGALPAGVDRVALAAELQPKLDAINPADGHTLSFDEVGAALSRILRILTAARFRLPKELVLFFKNLLYLTGFTASVAPDAEGPGQVAPVLSHFVGKYGPELAGAVAAG
jgi:ubiquinone biosynthesis protein